MGPSRVCHIQPHVFVRPNGHHFTAENFRKLLITFEEVLMDEERSDAGRDERKNKHGGQNNATSFD